MINLISLLIITSVPKIVRILIILLYTLIFSHILLCILLIPLLNSNNNNSIFIPLILLIQIIEQSYINENTFVLFLVSSILTIFTLFSISITIGSIYALISSVIGAIFLFANTNIIFTLLLLMQLTAILYTYTVIPYSTQSNIELSIQATLLKSIPVFYIIQTDISVDTIILLCTSLQSFVMLNTDNPNIAVL